MLVVTENHNSVKTARRNIYKHTYNRHSNIIGEITHNSDCQKNAKRTIKLAQNQHYNDNSNSM